MDKKSDIPPRQLTELMNTILLASNILAVLTRNAILGSPETRTAMLLILVASSMAHGDEREEISNAAGKIWDLLDNLSNDPDYTDIMHGIKNGMTLH